MKINRSKLKILARERVEILLINAIETAKDNIELAKRQATIMKQICLKHNLRRPYDTKQLFCKKCKKFIIPGVSSRVRLGYKPKAIKITCIECGHIYRKIINL